MATRKNRTIGPWLIWQIHEIRRISCMKFGGFHGKDLHTLHIQWICIGSDENTALSGFHHEIRWISCMKSSEFQALKFGGFHA